MESRREYLSFWNHAMFEPEHSTVTLWNSLEYFTECRNPGLKMTEMIERRQKSKPQKSPSLSTIPQKILKFPGGAII